MEANNMFQCGMCEGIFEKEWTDKEAKEESQELWGDLPEEEFEIICDTCFNEEFMKDIPEDLLTFVTQYVMDNAFPIHNIPPWANN